MEDERFWAAVDRSGGPTSCWIWRKAKNDHGYGIVRRQGRALRAHRWSYELTIGVQLSSTTVLMHSCDTPACVNPSHLSPGTHQENVEDKVRKQRHRHHDKHPHAKLNSAEVAEIRKMAGEITQRALAKRYGVAQPTISAIVNYQTWK